MIFLFPLALKRKNALFNKNLKNLSQRSMYTSIKIINKIKDMRNIHFLNIHWHSIYLIDASVIT
jgi:hypothetical protein